ncbi:unnamed protein product [Microthlaspi erraticum]|uniref:Reverse transcriptase Ty1/copia-type domain-containing protein n=1 Tax=Microthlaspi erraticum TaxID=1685480 RepID=A0A6D2JNG1_9BRAS|nr:unnamed protein product [Microthlaspi erraticum]
MGLKFEMSDLGRLTYYLGIKVYQHEGGITLKQERYALKILEESGLSDFNLVYVPIESSLKLAKSEEEKDIDATSYRKNVGCFCYLLHTRPDLSFCVGGTKLVYAKPSIISWNSNEAMLKKQEIVALSSCEAEFMAGTEAGKQAIWLQDFISEVTGSPCQRVVIRIDNQSAIALTKNLVFHGGSKHIHTRYYFIRECVENGQVEVEQVPGNEQKADILTKELGRIKFKEMRDLIGVREITRNAFQA